MKATFLSLALLLGLSLSVMSQPEDKGPKDFKEHGNSEWHPGKGGPRNPFAEFHLTEAQLTQFKKSKMALEKQLQPLRNQLGEAMAHQKSLTTADSPNLDAINQNIDKVGVIRIQMAKLRITHLMEIRSQLNEEQRLKFDAKIEKMIPEDDPRPRRGGRPE